MIGNRLKEERERLRLSQPVFAELAGAKKRTLIDWEKGVSSPTAVQLSALSKAGVDVTYVLTGSRPSAAQKITDDMNQARVTFQVLNSIGEPGVDYGRAAEFTAKFTRLDEEAKKTVEMMINTLLTKK